MQPSNDNRPAEFDAMVVRFTPLLYRRAFRLAPNDPEDLVNDTIAHALTNWRAMGNHKPTSWLITTMRGIASNAARMRERRVRIAEAIHRTASYPANQEHAVDVRLAVRELPKRDSTVLLMRAAEYTLEEVGGLLGVTRERVRQIEKRAVEAVAAAAAQADTRRALTA